MSDKEPNDAQNKFADMVQRATGFDPRTNQWDTDEVAALRAENERLRAEVVRLDDLADDRLAELERLRAGLCYVNPDGSHVRGCAQHEAQHPAQWCETLARAKRA